MTFFTKKYLLFFVLCMAITPCLFSSPISAKTTHTELFRVSQNPAFAKPREVLRHLIASQQKPTETRNTFCILGYRRHRNTEKASEVAWVYWKQQKAIILWEPSNLEIQPIAQLARSRRYLKMPDDFVRSETGINGSTYIETWEWANDLIKTCQAKGDKYTIQ
jgi:hypothetical protein